MAITLLDIRTQARQHADMENSQFISDPELTNYVNSSIAELHDLLVGAYGSDYFINDFTFAIVANQTDYTLPDDFYKLMGVDIQINDPYWYSVDAYNFNERNNNTGNSGWSLLDTPNVRYRLRGANLNFSPAPDGTYQARIFYIPVATKLVVDSDTLNDLNAYSEYVIVDAAIKMKQKEESDVSVLMNQKAALKRRIEEMANNRDAGKPESVSDIYAENDDYFFGRS